MADEHSDGTNEQTTRSDRKRSGVPVLATSLAVMLASGAVVAGVMSSGATADSTADPLAAGDTTAVVTDPTAPPADPTTTPTTTDQTPPSDPPPAGEPTTTPAPDPTPPPADPPAPPADPPPVVPADPPPVAPTDPPPAPADPVVQPAPPAAPAEPQAPVATTPAAPSSKPNKPVVSKSEGGRQAPTEVVAPTKAAKPTADLSHPAVPTTGDTGPVGSPSTFAQPAVSFNFVPTPADLRFYVRAAKTRPLPKLRKIDHDLAVGLATAGSNAKIHWALLAAVAQLESKLGKESGAFAGSKLANAPGDRSGQLASLAAFLRQHGANRNLASKGTQRALRTYFGDRKRGDRARALASFYGALGLEGMQNGLAKSESHLRKAVLADHRVSIYAAGRGDVKARRVDTRVLLVIEYLANATGKVKVSSLVSGHRLFTTSGSVSAHVYGRAMDISALAGTRIAGHQNPGQVTEKGVRLLLLMPKNAQPKQIISLLDLDGPTGNRGSFALSDHSDHIQVEY